MTEPSTIAQAAQYLAQRYEARESMDVMLQPFAPCDAQKSDPPTFPYDQLTDQRQYLRISGGK